MGVSIPVLGVPGVLDGGKSLTQLITSLNPLLDLRFNQATGNLLNYGSVSVEGVPTAITQNQTGLLGSNEAWSFNGTTSLVTLAAASIASVLSLTTQRWAFLCKPNALGESNLGTYMAFGNGPDSTEPTISLVSTNRLQVSLIASGVNPTAITANNQVDFVGSYAWVFCDYDDTDAMGLGRKARIFRGNAAGVTLLMLATNNAATGTLTPPTSDLILGNRAAAYTTWNGLFDWAVCSSGLWTPAAAPTDLSLMEAIVAQTPFP